MNSLQKYSRNIHELSLFCIYILLLPYFFYISYDLFRRSAITKEAGEGKEGAKVSAMCVECEVSEPLIIVSSFIFWGRVAASVLGGFVHKAFLSHKTGQQGVAF